MANGNGNGGLIWIRNNWMIITALVGVVATFTRMETKVQAMEPVQKQVQKLDKDVAVIQNDVGHLRKTMKKYAKDQKQTNQAILHKLDSLNGEETHE